MPANAQVEKLLAAIKSDPKRTGVLGVLLVVLAIFGGRALLTGSNQPLSSFAANVIGNAADKPAVSAKAANARADVLAAWMAQPIPVPQQDLFAVNLTYFPNDVSAASNDATKADSEEIVDPQTKLERAEADQKRHRAVVIENVRQQAEKLDLQSIVRGANPQAMINGRMVGEGDVVAEFRVLKIEPRKVIVEREGVKLSIAMN